MRITVPYDLSPAGAYCRGELRWEEGTLSAAVDGKTVFEHALEGVAELKQRTDIGCGRLEMCLRTDESADPPGAPANLPESENVHVCRFSMSCVSDVGEFCKAVNHWLKDGEALQWSEDELHHCPLCGRNYLPGMSTCLFCADKKQLWRRAWKMAGEYRALIIIAGVCMVICNAFQVVAPMLQRWLMDNVFSTEALEAIRGGAAVFPYGWTPERALWMLGAAIALSFALGQAFLAVSSLTVRKSGSYFTDRLRCIVYDKVQNLSVASMQRRTAGDLMKRVTQDTEMVKDFVNGMGRAAVEKLILLTAVAVILFATNWKLACFVVIPVPLTLFLMRQFWLRMYSMYEKQWVCSSRERHVLRDIIKGIRVVKTFGAEEREIEKFSAASQNLARVCTRNERFWSYVNPLTRLSLLLGEMLMLFFGGRMVLHQEISAGMLLQFTLFAGFMNEPLRWLAHFPQWLAEVNTSLVKLFEIIDEEPTIPQAENPVFDPIDGAVCFDSVQFGYKAYEPVLKDVCLDIAPGEMLGLVGHSGAGKTTIINLVLRLYDTDIGRINIGGRDIRDYDYAWLRENIGVVFQETFLFSGSIYDNIAYAKPKSEPAEIFRAARLANAHEFIIALPDGYNTVVGEDGHNLSGGERQRVAIARAVLRDPKILILDEATSALDPETESKIQQALERLVKDRTTIAIAHRLSTLRHASKLAVIDKGRVAELGTHRELLEKKGIYYGLVMAQRQMNTKA
ncbi:MAG: ABC transporter ATP-binding protein/permease [Oscillospiraceae bacterium]|nr:ABC transporter ATP-binding protein/permease [Oscillospiraceae bacterium]